MISAVYWEQLFKKQAHGTSQRAIFMPFFFSRTLFFFFDILIN
jgi:hypothetical protein